eukprot:11261056-Karenia_brevis.AAC.1
MDVREKFKNKPKQIEYILKDAMTIWDNLLRCNLYWVPEYNLSLQNEALDIEEKKHRIEQDNVIKKATKKELTGEPDQDPKGDGPKPKRPKAEPGALAPLGQAQVRRLEKLIPLIEEAQFGLASKVTQASAPNVKEFVPPNTVKKAIATEKDLARIIPAAKKMFQDGVAPKGA